MKKKTSILFPSFYKPLHPALLIRIHFKYSRITIRNDGCLNWFQLVQFGMLLSRFGLFCTFCPIHEEPSLPSCSRANNFSHYAFSSPSFSLSLSSLFFRCAVYKAIKHVCFLVAFRVKSPKTPLRKTKA